MRNFIIKTSILFCGIFYSFSAQALDSADIKNFFQKAGKNAKHALNCGNYDLYVPFYAWHNRLAYDDVDKYNENAWGLGVGKSFYDGNEWHAVYAMAFEDSNHHPQTIFGYAYQYNWDIGESGDWKAGVGYTLSLTQRSEYKFIPVPLPLPIAGISYKTISLQASYVPGVKNDGNVLFTWLRFSF